MGEAKKTMSSPAPMVSVIMPVFNGAPYVREAVDSILTQTFEDFEFIIVDDASTDNTWNLLNDYSDTRIRLLRHKSNMGLIAALNNGLAQARGRYIARMDADDRSLPNRLRKQFDYLEQNRDIGVLGGVIRIMDAEGQADTNEQWHLGYPSDPMILAWHLFYYDPISHPTVMFRRALYDQFGGYPDGDTHAEDYGYWVLLSSQTKFANLRDVVLHYRWHGGNISLREAESQRLSSARIRARAVASFIPTFVLPEKESYPSEQEWLEASDLTFLRITRELCAEFLRHMKPSLFQRWRIRGYAGRMMLRVLRHHPEGCRFIRYLPVAALLDPCFVNTAYDLIGRRIVWRRYIARVRKDPYLLRREMSQLP